MGNKDNWITEPKEYTEDDFVHIGKQALAVRRLNQAVRNGSKKRSDVCQVCGRVSARMFAHHWRGYDYPFDVWWVCPMCSSNLRFHDGRISLEDARLYISNLTTSRYKHMVYKHYRDCHVCGVDTKVGRFIVFDDGDSEFVCVHCLDNIAG